MEARSRVTRRRPALVAVLGLMLAVAAACDLPARALTYEELRKCEVAVLGDSLSVGSQPHLGDALRGKGCTLAWVDAAVSRRTGDGIEALRQRIAEGEVPAVLIVGLGTNDRYQLTEFPDRVDRVMELANGRHVVWIESAYPPVHEWINATLTGRMRTHPNLTVMAWDQPYWANAEWRSTDEVHCTKEGYRARASLMAVAAAERVVK